MPARDGTFRFARACVLGGVHGVREFAADHDAFKRGVGISSSRDAERTRRKASLHHGTQCAALT